MDLVDHTLDLNPQWETEKYCEDSWKFGGIVEDDWWHTRKGAVELDEAKEVTTRIWNEILFATWSKNHGSPAYVFDVCPACHIHPGSALREVVKHQASASYVWLLLSALAVRPVNSSTSRSWLASLPAPYCQKVCPETTEKIGLAADSIGKPNDQRAIWGRSYQWQKTERHCPRETQNASMTSLNHQKWSCWQNECMFQRCLRTVHQIRKTSRKLELSC